MKDRSHWPEFTIVASVQVNGQTHTFEWSGRSTNYYMAGRNAMLYVAGQLTQRKVKGRTNPDSISLSIVTRKVQGS